MEKSRFAYASLCFLAIALSFFYVGVRLRGDFLNGGNAWKQGDWLINSTQHPIRRSFSGDILISISDWMGVSPLLVTVGFQSLILFFLAVTVGAVVFKNWNNTAFLAVILSPAFFPVFWAVDAQGSMRKEILAYASMSALVILALAPRFRRFFLLLSVILFSFATLSHEGMVFFAPVYIFLTLVLADNDRITKTEFHLSSFVIVLVSIAAFTLAVLRHSVDDYLLVCSPLIERGVDDNICSGAIRWLERYFNQNNSVIMERISAGKLFKLALAYTLSFATILFFLWHTKATRGTYIITSVIGVTFLPLYFLGIDWGRWLNFHFTSVFFIISIFLSLGLLKTRKEANMTSVFAISFLNLFWAVGHVNPIRQHGLLQEAFRALSSLV